ncbi:hypothetical protein FB451DRAFT_1147529, partial [Mycena latifolia]
MPRRRTVTQIRLNNIVTCLGAAVNTLEVISKSLETPFLLAISSTVRSLSMAVQTIQMNKGDCTEMLERIHELLYAIIHLHITSDSAQFSPGTLNDLARFTETLQKIHTFVEAQQEKSKLKQFLRQGEMSTLLKSCRQGLARALEVFKVQGVQLSNDVMKMQEYAQETHLEVLDLISGLSDGKSSDGGSSISRVFSSFQHSSNSLSLLPSEPKIFYGRDTEVSAIIQTLRQVAPRVAILGAGGMGKTSLARAVLHHPETTAQYAQNRFFVACDTTSNSVQLAALIGAHVGIKPAKDLTQPVVNYFNGSAASLLIVDNLETLWEARESRREVENFLSLLTDISHLALIITMRGAERPANVRWAHPFLEPLKPLTVDAARKTFIDIADDDHSEEDIDKILRLADNMPLAINLIAHLVDFEGVSNVLSRWETENTSLLSEGHDRETNLDLSIALSFESPRLDSLPQSRSLLSLLSLLPDGLSDLELQQSKLPIGNILACKAALLRTSLAYMDDHQRLNILGPIREYVYKQHPPTNHMVHPILHYFNKLLEICETQIGTVSGPGIVNRISSNFANIRNILVKGLNKDSMDVVNTIYCALYFDRFSSITGRGPSQLMDKISHLLPHPCDPRLEVYYITRLLEGQRYHHISNTQHLVDQAIEYFSHFDDTDLKCRVYNIVAEYYRVENEDIPKALHFSHAGLTLSISTGNTKRQSELLVTLAWIKYQIGNYSEGQVDACDSQKLAKISADALREARALQIESICWRHLGSYSHSVTLFERARGLLGLCGMSGGTLDHDILNSLAEVHQSKSEYVQAHNINTEILHSISAEQDLYLYAITLQDIAQTEVESGAPKHDVQRNIDKANSLLMMVYSTEGKHCGIIQAALRLREGEFDAANNLFQRCLKSAWGIDNDIVSYCLTGLGDICQWGTTNQPPFAWTATFLIHSLKLKRKLEIHKALQFLGDFYLA